MKNLISSSVRYLAIGLFAFFGVLSTARAQDGYDRHVTVVNDTSHTVRSFYASNTSRGTWEEDILRRDVLLPGEQVDVNIDDGTGRCYFDFKAVFSNGAEIVRRHVDVCGITEWTLYE